jgi:hypothetical protein
VRRTLAAVPRPFNAVPRPQFAVLEALIGVSRTLLIERRVSGAVLDSRQLVSQVPLEFPLALDAKPSVIDRMPRFLLVAPLVVETLTAVLGTVLLPVSDEPRTLFVRNRTFEQVPIRCAAPPSLLSAASDVCSLAPTKLASPPTPRPKPRGKSPRPALLYNALPPRFDYMVFRKQDKEGSKMSQIVGGP